jgi:hypothetical protein
MSCFNGALVRSKLGRLKSTLGARGYVSSIGPAIEVSQLVCVEYVG